MVETTKPVKLTTPQVNALADLLEGPQSWSTTWAPAKKLLELRYATVKTGRYGSTTFTITDTGRAHPAVARA